MLVFGNGNDRNCKIAAVFKVKRIVAAGPEEEKPKFVQQSHPPKNWDASLQ